MHNTPLVDAELHLPRLGIFNRQGHVRGDRSDFRVGHQATGTKNLPQRSNNPHGIRSGNHDIKRHVASLDHGSQIVHTDNVGACCSRFISLCALRKHGNPFGLAGSIWQHDGAAHHLVRFFSVNT